MSASSSRPIRFVLTFGLDVPADLAALSEIDARALNAAQAILDDLAYGRYAASCSGTETSAVTCPGLPE